MTFETLVIINSALQEKLASAQANYDNTRNALNAYKDNTGKMWDSEFCNDPKYKELRHKNYIASLKLDDIKQAYKEFKEKKWC